MSRQNQSKNHLDERHVSTLTYCAVDHIFWVVESGIAKPHEIGIATPYSGQLVLYYEVLARIGKGKPELHRNKIRVGTGKWWGKDVTVGTTQWWQGKQAEYMVVDLGFMSDARRLERPAFPIATGTSNLRRQRLCSAPDQLSRRNQETQSRPSLCHSVVRMDVEEGLGRIVEMPVDDLSQKYVKLAPISSVAMTSALLPQATLATPKRLDPLPMRPPGGTHPLPRRAPQQPDGTQPLPKRSPATRSASKEGTVRNLRPNDDW